MLITILGRQPAISLAELESLLGAFKLQPLGDQAAFVDIEATEIDLSRLGGTMKLAKQLTVLETTDVAAIEQFLVEKTPEHVAHLPEGKLRLGLSLYGFEINPKRLLAVGLSAKKVIKASGRSVRLVPNKTHVLSTAQVIHNQLTGPLGWELVFVRHGNQTVVGQTIAVQDITAYTARDQARPKRDARMGMLPPKLAQIIINLAGKHTLPMNAKVIGEPQLIRQSARLLDPFCGTGVILQEALLMGYETIGSDIDPRMIEFSKTNLEWLSENQTTTPQISGKYSVLVADATSASWSDIDLIATETYLGRAFSALPSSTVLEGVVQDVDTIIRKFLSNVVRQTKPGFRMCLAVPAWKTPDGFRHLPLLDHLTDLGYTRLSFVHARNDELIYHREGQVVGRELVVLTRN